MNYQEDENINTATHITVENYTRIATATLNNLVNNIYEDITQDENQEEYDMEIKKMFVINYEVSIMTIKDAMLIIYAYEGDVMEELTKKYGNECYSWKTMAQHVIKQQLLKKLQE